MTISGNASANTSGFHGWIVVNGSLSINGSCVMYGLGYAMNDLSYVGTGGQIQGQLISANIKDTIATGYTYQGRLIRPPVVSLQNPPPPSLAKSSADSGKTPAPKPAVAVWPDTP